MAAFALDLDHDGIRLLRQNGADWEELDRAPLDAPDLADRMQSMQATAARLAEGLLETELIIPPSQILYTVLPQPEGRVDKAHVAAALDGLTPCPVDEMVFDWQRVPGGLAVAALDVNTLDEAESFAVTYGFNPVRFTALPRAEDFPGQPDFGPTQFVRQEAWLALISGPKDAPETAGELDDEPDDEPVENLFAEDPEDVAGASAPIAVIRPEQRLRVEDIPTESPTDVGTPTPALAAPQRRAARPRAEEPPRDWRRIGATTAIAATVITGLVATAVYLVTPDETTLPLADAGEETTERQPDIAAAPVAPSPEIGTAFDEAAAPEPAADLRLPTASVEAPSAGEEAPGLAPVTVSVVPDQGSVALPEPEVTQLSPTGDQPSGAPAPARLRAPMSGPVAPRIARKADLPEGPVPSPVRRHTADRLTPALPSAEARIAPERMTARARMMIDGPGALAEDRSVLPPGWLRSTDFWQAPPPPPPDPVGETIEELYLAAIDPRVPADDAFALPGVPPVHDMPVVATLPPEQGRVFSLNDEGRVVATPEGAETPDGVVVIRGRPDVLPPARPVIALAALSPEMAEAVAGHRPRARPGNLTERYERAVYGGRTRAEISSLSPRNRPASDQERALQDANAAASALAVSVSLMPPERPGDLVTRRVAAQQARPAPVVTYDTTAAVAAAVAEPEAQPEPEAPSAAPAIPTSASVARQATIANAINLRRVNLIGVYGSANDRRALVRLPSGRYVKVEVGDRIDGGRVAAIRDGELLYVKGGQNVTLRVPSG